MRTQKEYWNKKISEWTKASYGKGSDISLTERIATYFRSVDKRKDAALQLVGPLAKNKIVLDLGCGLGEFSFELLRYQPKKVLAYDISEIAIVEAKRIAKKLKTNSKIEFRAVDVARLKKFPRFDIAVGLGFIDYLNTPQLRHLFKLIDNKTYLFSYFEKKASLFNLLHKIYIKLQNCPGAYKYTRTEIKKLIPTGTKLSFLKKNGLLFINNSKRLNQS